MVLLEEIAEHIPISAMTTPVELGTVPFAGSYDDAARSYYGLSQTTKLTKPIAKTTTGETEDNDVLKRTSSSVPFLASFQQLSDLTACCVQLLLLETPEPAQNLLISDSDSIQTTFMSGLSLILLVVRALNKQPPLSIPLQASWDAEGWMDSVADLLTSKVFDAHFCVEFCAHLIFPVSLFPNCGSYCINCDSVARGNLHSSRAID